MRAWDDFLVLQESMLGKETVDKWLRPFKVSRFDACNLHLEIDDSFKALWFEEHMRHRVEMHLFNNNKKAIKVHIELVNAVQAKMRAPKKKNFLNHAPFSLSFDELDPRATFDTFICTSSNQLAYKLVRDPGGFNPIYICGKKGCGKTHLLMAATNAMQQAGIKARYVKAETFTEHVVNAIRMGEMQAFRKAYRMIDALLVDDVDVFSKKIATQEEFFHTFNTLHVEGKQIILSSNLLPQDLKFIEMRLVSRFEWGIVAPLQMLDRSGLKALVEAKKATLAPSHLDFLIETFGHNTKSFVRALDALALRTHLDKTETSLKAILADLIAQEEKALLSPQKIIRYVADHYGIRSDDILGKAQTRESTLPRQLAMHLCRLQLSLSYIKIGEVFDRDHSTVMTSIKQIHKQIEAKDQILLSALHTIAKRLEND